MRWLIVLPFERSGHMGMDFRDELQAMGHEVRTFAYRRETPLYKNRGTKETYQRFILGRLERACLDWRPAVVLVIKGGPIEGALIDRVKAKTGARFFNLFPDNPLLMIPFERIEAYDLFFTKERYALRALEHVGLKNLHYLPLYCVPDLHHKVALREDEAPGVTSAISVVGSCYRTGSACSRAFAVPHQGLGRRMESGALPSGPEHGGGQSGLGPAKLAVYAGSTLSLNHHHPLNDIVGVNTRAFELAASGVCQVADLKEDLPSLFTPGEELVAYRDLEDLKRQLDYYLAHPDEAHAIGANAQTRALKEHTLRHRIETMLAVMEERFGRTS